MVSVPQPPRQHTRRRSRRRPRPGAAAASMGRLAGLASLLALLASLAYVHAWVRLPPPPPSPLLPTAGPRRPLQAALGDSGAVGESARGGSAGDGGTGRGRKRRDPSAPGSGPAAGSGVGKGKGGTEHALATAASNAEGQRRAPRAAYGGGGGDEEDGDGEQQSRPQGRRRTTGGNSGEEGMGRPGGQQQQRPPRRPRPPQGGLEQEGAGQAWDRPNGRDGGPRQNQQGQGQQQYPRKRPLGGGQQQQGGQRRGPGGGYNNNNNGGGNGNGERRGPPGGGWLSVAHHKGEGARERLITSHLKNAGNAGGVPALLEKVDEYLDELNAVHCTMIINRISKAPQTEREFALSSRSFAALMDRSYAVLGEFGNRDTAQAAISLARFKDAKRIARWQPLVRALQEKARDGMAEMTPKELAMCINAFANLPEPPGKDYWDEFSRHFLPQAEEFDKQGLSMVINGMAKMLYRPSPAVLLAVEQLTLQRMETCNTQELANILNGFGKLDHVPSPEYLEAFERISRPKLPQFQPQELSMTFNAMSRIGCRPSDAYLQEFEAAVLRALPHFKTQESAMTINAFTKMADYQPSPAFFEGVERCVVGKVKLHRAQEVANTIHGLGRLGYNPSAKFVEAFAQHAMAVMDKMKTQELGNLINGLSKMTYRPSPAFFNRFMDVSQPLLPTFTTQEVSNAVNGLMRLGCKPDEEYLRATVQVAIGSLGEYKDQELACLFHAYGRMLFFPGVPFMEAYEAEFARRVREINSQALAMTLNAFNRLNWKPRATLLQEMEKALERATCAGLIFGAELAQAVNGLANLNHTPGRSFLAAFKNVILDQKAYVDLSTIAVILWSLSALDPPRMKGFYTEMVEVACRRLEGEPPEALPASFKGERSSMYYSSLNEVVPTVGDESLEPPMVMCVRQLLQTCRYLTTLKNPVDKGLFSRFSGLLEQKWAELQQEKYEVHTSFFHRDVLGVVEKGLGLPCEIEVEDEAYTLDMVIYPGDGGLPIVVEADGPHHFFRNAPEEAMGFTVFKHRLLEGRRDRWRAVVSVPQAEWLRAKDSDPRRGRTALLVKKLRDAGLALDNVKEDQLDPS